MIELSMPAAIFSKTESGEIAPDFPIRSHACFEPAFCVPLRPIRRPNPPWLYRSNALSPRAGNVSPPQGLPGLAASVHRLEIVRSTMEADDAGVFQQSGMSEQVCRGLCRQSYLNDAIQSGECR